MAAYTAQSGSFIACAYATSTCEACFPKGLTRDSIFWFSCPDPTSRIVVFVVSDTRSLERTLNSGIPNGSRILTQNGKLFATVLACLTPSPGRTTRIITTRRCKTMPRCGSPGRTRSLLCLTKAPVMPTISRKISVDVERSWFSDPERSLNKIVHVNITSSGRNAAGCREGR